MRRRKLLYGLGASGAVLVPSGLTAAAYNSFTVNREATINVATDAAGLLGLTTPDGSTGIVQTDGDGELSIDLGRAGGSGQNIDSTLVVGNPGDPSTTPAFSFTNNGVDAHDIDISYDIEDDPDETDDVTFDIYPDSGGSVTDTVTESTDVSLTGVASGTTHRVIMTIDTETLSNTADLSGTLSFTLS